MDIDVKPKVGEWVRFYRDGRMVIGVIQYVRPAASWSASRWQADTDFGTIESRNILERRAPAGAGLSTEARLKECWDLLSWLDARGGLGLDVHAMIRKALHPSPDEPSREVAPTPAQEA